MHEEHSGSRIFLVRDFHLVFVKEGNSRECDSELVKEVVSFLGRFFFVLLESKGRGDLLEL